MDRYVLLLLDRLIGRVRQAYRDFSFHLVYHELLTFCTVTLSAFYLDVLKDRLYCEGAASRERRAAQTVLYALCDGLVRLMAPILPFTAEEVWGHLPERETPSVHMARFPEPSGRRDESLLLTWETLRGLRDVVNKALEEARRRGEIGKSLEAAVDLRPASEEEARLLEERREFLKDLFIVSSVRLLSLSPSGEASASVSRALGEKCRRCWVITAEPQGTGEETLCPRCARVVGSGA
jgi:isoleucyl-tRNA synthetase